VLASFRHVRDQIRAFVQTLPEALDGEQPPVGVLG
jgi:hypothetical protein